MSETTPVLAVPAKAVRKFEAASKAGATHVTASRLGIAYTIVANPSASDSAIVSLLTDAGIVNVTTGNPYSRPMVNIVSRALKALGEGVHADDAILAAINDVVNVQKEAAKDSKATGKRGGGSDEAPTEDKSRGQAVDYGSADATTISRHFESVIRAYAEANDTTLKAAASKILSPVIERLGVGATPARKAA